MQVQIIFVISTQNKKGSSPEGSHGSVVTISTGRIIFYLPSHIIWEGIVIRISSFEGGERDSIDIERNFT